MLSHCLKCRKSTESKNTKVVKTKTGGIMLLSKYEECDSKKPKFIKEEEVIGLLSTLGMKVPLSKISLVSPLLL